MGTKLTGNDLSLTLFGKTRRLILHLLYSSPREDFYLRQIARASGVVMGSVQRELKTLADAGIIIRTGRGTQVYYMVNSQCPVFEELKKIIKKTVGFSDVPNAR